MQRPLGVAWSIWMFVRGDSAVCLLLKGLKVAFESQIYNKVGRDPVIFPRNPLLSSDLRSSRENADFCTKREGLLWIRYCRITRYLLSLGHGSLQGSSDIGDIGRYALLGYQLHNK